MATQCREILAEKDTLCPQKWLATTRSGAELAVDAGAVDDGVAAFEDAGEG
jgi:hypothetical protein